MDKNPCLCIISPLAGNNPNVIPTPGDFLVDHFLEQGYDIVGVSSATNKYIRLLEICRSIAFYRGKIDLIILSIYMGKSFLVEDIASCLGRYFNKPIIMVLHNGITPAFISMFPNWSKKVLSRSTTIVSPSKYLPRIIKPYGYRSIVIPNPIDLSNYNFNLHKTFPPNLLWIRSFYPYYNPQMAIRVVSNLKAKYPDIKLVMAGKDKGLLSEIKELAKDYDVIDNIRFPGFLTHQQKIIEFQNANILINTNNVDNAPVSIVEAWATGLPVISTSVGGVPDMIINGINGILVPDDDDDAMSDKIIDLVERPNLVNQLSIEGRKMAEDYAWENIFPMWKNLFSEILDRR